MGVTSLVTELYNWQYLKNEQIKQTDFLHVGTDSQKLKAYQKFSGWAYSKMGVASLAMGL